MAKRFDWSAIVTILQKRKLEGASLKDLVAEVERDYGKKVTPARISQVLTSFKKQEVEKTKQENV